jgi:hypothetical protein
MFDSLDSRNDLYAVPFPYAIRCGGFACCDWRVVLSRERIRGIGMYGLLTNHNRSH